jgi:hypothetical protein
VTLSPARRGLVCALAALACALAAASARANGDPASDVLIGRYVYLPYGSVSPDTAGALRGIVAEANRAGYRIKVAVIGTKVDMGLVTGLWLKPHTYARFLGGELLFVYKKGRLVIEMPNGFGIYRGTKADERLLARLPTGEKADELVTNMAAAVQRLAAASGYKVSIPKSKGGSSGGTRLAIALGGVGILALLGLLTYLYLPRARKRRRAA